ncbi:MAG: hypothetical protein KDE28_11765, partial [Anaerolineales bacterium]|nr:hypothetical protein [Anaerolineales bacterium]
MRKRQPRHPHKYAVTLATLLSLGLLSACAAAVAPSVCNEMNGVISVPPGYLQEDPDLDNGFAPPAGGLA